MKTTTRTERQNALNRAIRQSKADGLTFVLIREDHIVVTPNADEAKAYVHTRGYRVYAKCDGGYMVL